MGMRFVRFIWSGLIGLAVWVVDYKVRVLAVQIGLRAADQRLFHTLNSSEHQ